MLGHSWQFWAFIGICIIVLMRRLETWVQSPAPEGQPAVIKRIRRVVADMVYMYLGFWMIMVFVWTFTIVAGLVWLFVILAQSFGTAILESDPLALMFLSAIAVVLLFMMRTRYPNMYGIFEIVVGASSIALSANARQLGPHVLVASQASALYLVATRAFGFLGGIYIVIRGMDHLDKHLPGSIREPWDQFFRGYPRK